LDLVTVETAVHGDFFVFHVLYKYSMYICMYNQLIMWYWLMEQVISLAGKVTIGLALHCPCMMLLRLV